MRAFLCAALIAAAPFAATADAPLSKAEIEEIVRAYILDNPEVVAEALQAHARAQEAEAAAAQREAAVALSATLLDDERTPRIGAEDPKVTLVEFFDYNCGYCRRVADTVIALSEQEDDLTILLVEMPILGPGSTEAARAALAAAKQGAYWDFHVAMLKRRGRADRAAALDVAGGLGLDVGQLEKDMASAEVAALINENLARAQRVGVRGTPAFIVGDAFIPGAVPIENLQAAIAEARGS